MIDFLYNYFIASYKATNIMRELYQLSDRELSDLGINRNQIPSIAYDATKNRD
jgi:uncharacterized protein YjiS (DUF1127 family)